MFANFTHPNPKTFDVPLRQYFSLPFGIISYITQNPISPDGLLKLQKTCKYFFANNKIAVIGGENIRCTESCFAIYRNKFHSHIRSFQKGMKYWLANELLIYTSLNDIWCLPKNIYRCTLRVLKICHTNLSMNQLNFLMAGGKITKLGLNNINIKDDEDELLPLDKILAKVPNLTYFVYSCEDQIFTNQMFRNMNSLVFNSIFDRFELSIHNLEANADTSQLINFIKHNFIKWYSIFMCKTTFIFNFKMKSNSEIYRQKLRSELRIAYPDRYRAPTVYIN